MLSFSRLRKSFSRFAKSFVLFSCIFALILIFGSNRNSPNNLSVAMGVAEINLIGAVAKGNLYLKESNCLIPLWVELEGKPIAIK